MIAACIGDVMFYAIFTGSPTKWPFGRDMDAVGAEVVYYPNEPFVGANDKLYFRVEGHRYTYCEVGRAYDLNLMPVFF